MCVDYISEVGLHACIILYINLCSSLYIDSITYILNFPIAKRKRSISYIALVYAKNKFPYYVRLYIYICVCIYRPPEK